MVATGVPLGAVTVTTAERLRLGSAALVAVTEALPPLTGAVQVIVAPAP
jgi:hypothetical protein